LAPAGDPAFAAVAGRARTEARGPLHLPPPVPQTASSIVHILTSFGKHKDALGDLHYTDSSKKSDGYLEFFPDTKLGLKLRGMLEAGNRVPLTAATVAELLEESFAKGEANKGFFQEIKMKLEQAQADGKNEIYLRYYQIKDKVAFMVQAEALYKTKANFDGESDQVKQEAWDSVREHFSAMAAIYMVKPSIFYIGKPSFRCSEALRKRLLQTGCSSRPCWDCSVDQ
jgi:hypothetical protein